MIDLTPEELELTALSAMLTRDAVVEAQQRGVDSMSFQTPEHVPVWEYLLERAGRNQNSTRGDVKMATGVTLHEGITDVETLVVELVKNSVIHHARQLVFDSMDTLKPGTEKDPSAVIRHLSTSLMDVVQSTTRLHQYLYDGDAQGRLARITDRVNRVKGGEVVGIPTGLTVFDNKGDTWKPGEVVAVVGSPTIGKSWFCIRTAAYAYWYAGSKVLFLSPESTAADVEDRMDPIMARFLEKEAGTRYGLSNAMLRKGFIDIDVYKRYLDDFARLHGERSDWVTIDSGESGYFTVEDIVMKAREHRPDMMVIDGFHLIRGAGKSWENIKYASETIKGLAQSTGMVILAATQAQRNAVMAADDTPEMGQVAYGMGLIEACNRMIALGEVRGKPDRRVFTVEKFRDGEVIKKRQYLKYDVDAGNIYQFEPSANEKTGVVDFDLT